MNNPNLPDVSAGRLIRINFNLQIEDDFHIIMGL